MARALSHDTRLIVMDEPSAALDQQEVQTLFRVIRDLTAAGRRRRLHLPPARGDPPGRRPGDRPQGRPHGGHRPARPRHPDLRADPADDRPRDRVRLPAAPERRPRPPPPCSRSRASALDQEVRRRQLLGPRPARSSASPAWSAPAARRSSRPCTAPAARRRGTVTVDGKRLRRGSVGAAVKAGIGLAPEERKSQGLLLDQAVYRNITISEPRPVRPWRLPRQLAPSARRRAS